MLEQYCASCHNDRIRAGNGFLIQPLKAENLAADQGAWEKVLRRMSLGEMPPKGMPRPTPVALNDFTHWLESSLDQNAAANPNPGRATLRRLNRVEYANAIRDLLALDSEVATSMAASLPADDSGYGFDNIADVLTMSRTLMNQYILVGGKVARLVTGDAPKKPVTTEYKIPRDPPELFVGVPAYNERSTEKLPISSRGGGAFTYYAPYDGDYEVSFYLNNNSNNEQELYLSNKYEARIRLKAGPRVIGATFRRDLTLEENLNPGPVSGRAGPPPSLGKPVDLPLNIMVDGAVAHKMTVPSFAVGPNLAQVNYPRDLMELAVTGPYDVVGPGTTPSRDKIFVCKPTASAASENACAKKILTTLAEHAYRRPVTAVDIDPLMKIYAEGRQVADFQHGVSYALQAVLVSPNFLFMVKPDLPSTKQAQVQRISDIELASRLSFFLWSSIPDTALLEEAKKNRLRRPAVLRAQVERMLADPKAKALTDNFGGQWLYLRRLEFQRPDAINFPNFDERLRVAMKTETEMFVDTIFRQNKSILDLLTGDYTFLNQRLAEHYGIPGVNGPSFRKVTLPASTNRSGLLGKAAILTVTSYNDRTSVVLRGKWILENILSSPPPPPPPDIPALNESSGGKKLSVRAALELHRANPVCASCHSKMDPLGFALENFDGVGGWRDTEAGGNIDVSATMPDGVPFAGPSGLKTVLLSRKEAFVDAFTERLMTYALGRGIEAYDMPTVRDIRRQAAKEDYRMNTLLMGIIQSTPFTMRRTSVQ
jgi:hypothetical protein